MPNESEKCNYNPNLASIKNIEKGLSGHEGGLFKVAFKGSFFKGGP